MTDFIADFTRGDKINVSLIDANSAAAGNQAFSFVVNFTGVRGQLQWDALGNNTYAVSGDLNGDRVADFAIQVRGTAPLGNLLASDFIL